MNQTYIMFGHPGVSMSAPDRVLLNLGNSILGGGASASRLGDVVREAAGLAYDVRSVFAYNRDGGAFWASVQTARPAEALKLMLSEIEEFTASGPTLRELNEVKDYFLGSFPLRYSSNGGKLVQMQAIELYGLGLDWLERYPEKVRAATLADVNSAIRQRIRPGRYVMVVLGNTPKEELGLTDVEWIE